MLTPRQPVEARRQDRFRPPHCPWPECDAHRGSARFRWCRWGFYRRACDPPRRRVRRYRCLHCRRTFSTQSFACTYYLKRPELLEPVVAGLVAGSAHRQLARSLRCAPATVTHLAPRVGRHCLLVLRLAARRAGPPREPLVADDFETFVFSQLDRLAVVTPVGQRSGYVYGFEGASHRGSSRRAARKRALRRPLPPRDPAAVVRSFRAMLDAVTTDTTTLDLLTDDHPAYRAAVASHPRRRRIRHRVYRNPPRGPGADPEEARERDRALWPVDRLHGLLRHSQAHHRRETIAFGRRSNAVLERMALALVWRNLVKRRTERSGAPVTPATLLGVAPRPLAWREVFAERLFPARVGLPARWEAIYRRDLTTPAVGRNRRHRARHAY